MPIGGINISFTKEVTILPKAPPITTAIAKSTTLPCTAKSLNSWKNFFIYLSFCFKSIYKSQKKIELCKKSLPILPNILKKNFFSSFSSRTIAGVVFVFLGAVCYSSKSIFAKLLYQHEIDTLSLIALRMTFAMPFYLLIALFYKPKVTKQITRQEWLYTMGLGFLGYYFTSILNFWGLQYVTATVERLIVFIYPTLVILISAIFYKKVIKPKQYLALLLTYIGILTAFIGNIQLSAQKNFLWGASLIFVSAFTYALYLVWAENLIKKIGSISFTAWTMVFSGIFVAIHYMLFAQKDIWHYSQTVYSLSFGLALVATVLPSFLVSAGISRIGSNNAGIVASIGPISVIILAYIFLNEQADFWQYIATLLVLTGILMITIQPKEKKTKQEEIDIM
ncbi:MAG: EamA/RhaT family transporter [Cytophagales bacterium]|nr:MAG: EamA/RhaT family transporter [Cytophagales bacterium]